MKGAEKMKKYEELTFGDDFMFSAVLYDNPDIAKQLAEKITGRKVREIVRMSKEEMLGTDPLVKESTNGCTLCG